MTFVLGVTQAQKRGTTTPNRGFTWPEVYRLGQISKERPMDSGRLVWSVHGRGLSYEVIKPEKSPTARFVGDQVPEGFLGSSAALVSQ